MAFVCMYDIRNYVCNFIYVAKAPIARPFIKCFEKGTPNFLSVTPCKFFVHEILC